MAEQIEKVGWTVKEWHQSAGLSVRMTNTLIHTGELKSVTVGRRRIITESPREFFQKKVKKAP